MDFACQYHPVFEEWQPEKPPDDGLQEPVFEAREPGFQLSAGTTTALLDLVRLDQPWETLPVVIGWHEVQAIL